jgi:hypothetical protein
VLKELMQKRIDARNVLIEQLETISVRYAPKDKHAYLAKYRLAIIMSDKEGKI